MQIDFECEYEFEELRLFGEGLMAWGTATLVHDGGGEFYVSTITLTNGTHLKRHVGSGIGSMFSKRLFDIIAAQIENDEHAKDFFLNALEEGSAPDQDRAYDERRDHAAMGWVA
ncbi:hypothetical protein [Sinorhizobium meliloti]|uniref:hypothetical protein n=1 Tax=Rhizobium meliloti TaxID=382 RepID=UPI000B49B8EA|nr:hypothetical protein [Sinorhizobium meliloti]ASP90767.1 hypothetical protein CDO25_05865 [Sinorhizobium meliloti]MQX60130.1 hypothetical protein [Sinorhizobium meliloti]